MIRFADVIETFEADFLAHYGPRVTHDQRRALAAMRACRGPTSPRMELECPACARRRLLPHSCGPRHGPHVHLLMPAAAVDGARQRWRTRRYGRGRAPYLFLHPARAQVFRAKRLAGLKAAPRYEDRIRSGRSSPLPRAFRRRAPQRPTEGRIRRQNPPGPRPY
mgnify:CR=1 FL=1